MKGLFFFLPYDKPKDRAVGTYYGWYGELVAGPRVTGVDTIYEYASDLDNKDAKGAGDDDDGEKEDDDRGEGDDGGAGDLDGGVEEEEGNDKESDEDHSGSGHLGIPVKGSPLDTLRKPPPLDTPEKLLDITEDAIVFLNGSKISRLIATLALILIAIIINTIARSGTSASGNSTSEKNPAILSIVELSAASNDAANFQKLLDTTKDSVVILDGGKVSRLIATLASILIAMVVNTTAHSGTSAFKNPIPRNNLAIPSVIKLFAADNDATDFFANVLGNPFGNPSQNASPADPAVPAADFFALNQEQESSDYHGDLTYA